LPSALDKYELRVPRYYIRALALVVAHDIKVVFLYMPRYGGIADATAL